MVKKHKITLILTLLLCSFSLQLEAMDWLSGLKNQLNTAVAATYNTLLDMSFKKELSPVDIPQATTATETIPGSQEALVPIDPQVVINASETATEKKLLHNKIIDIVFERSKYQQTENELITESKTAGDIASDNTNYLLAGLYSSVSPLTDSKNLQTQLQTNLLPTITKEIRESLYRGTSDIMAVRDGFIEINNEIYTKYSTPFVANAVICSYNAQTGNLILAKAGHDHAIVFNKNGKILKQTSDIYKPFMGMDKRDKRSLFPIMETTNVHLSPEKSSSEAIYALPQSLPVFILLVTQGVVAGYKSTDNAIKTLATNIKQGDSLEQAVHTLLLNAGQNLFRKQKPLSPRAAVLIKIDINKTNTKKNNP